MNTSSATTPAEYRERLQQAKRVLKGLSEQQRATNFNIARFAVDSSDGVVACIAGFCGLDPWFQERGFFTTVGETMGSTSIMPEIFFGTGKPFYVSEYLPKTTVTVDDALAALDRSIELFADNSIACQPVAQ
jgi:hypothetical protein